MNHHQCCFTAFGEFIQHVFNIYLPSHSPAGAIKTHKHKQIKDTLTISIFFFYKAKTSHNRYITRCAALWHVVLILFWWLRTFTLRCLVLNIDLVFQVRHYFKVNHVFSTKLYESKLISSVLHHHVGPTYRVILRHYPLM